MRRVAKAPVLVGLVVLGAILWGLWDLYSVSDLFYNSFSWLTHKVRIYPVECNGKLGLVGNVCCGSLGLPLDSRSFTVSASHQKVFTDVFPALFGALHNCDVQDDLNWSCTTYWNANGTRETDKAHGQCFDINAMKGGDYSFLQSDCPAESEASRADRLRADALVFVDRWSWWAGRYLGRWERHKGIWSDSPNSYVTHDPLLCK